VVSVLSIALAKMGKLDALYYSATRYENCDYRDHFSVLQVPARDIKNLAIPYLLLDSV
jgi:hypothetical protein